ncbi:hypothetical protein J6590_041557 [Homalodisca vitripennis]|nr:hypothetical protein J6590_041557 [Homalodisca vitripennis]
MLLLCSRLLRNSENVLYHVISSRCVTGQVLSDTRIRTSVVEGGIPPAWSLDGVTLEFRLVPECNFVKLPLRHPPPMLDHPTWCQRRTRYRQVTTNEGHTLPRCVRSVVYHDRPDDNLDAVQILARPSIGVSKFEKNTAGTWNQTEINLDYFLINCLTLFESFRDLSVG